MVKVGGDVNGSLLVASQGMLQDLQPMSPSSPSFAGSLPNLPNVSSHATFLCALTLLFSMSLRL